VKIPHGGGRQRPAIYTRRPRRLMSLVSPRCDLLCLMETWHDDDSAVLRCLRGATYNVVDRARPRTADDLSVNHGRVAVVDIALLQIDIADHRPFEIVCARALSAVSSSSCTPATLTDGL